MSDYALDAVDFPVDSFLDVLDLLVDILFNVGWNNIVFMFLFLQCLDLFHFMLDRFVDFVNFVDMGFHSGFMVRVMRFSRFMRVGMVRFSLVLFCLIMVMGVCKPMYISMMRMMLMFRFVLSC